MKLEKIDNNKIRCYLNSEDLSERQLDLSELAYGSEKARQLFHEMLEEASAQFGLDFEGSPIMVEAIPTSKNSITLIISKVDDPEELDPRFSKFAPSSEHDDILSELSSLLPDMLDGLELNEDDIEEDTDSKKTSEAEPENSEADSIRIFGFDSIDEVSNAAKLLFLDDEIQSSLFYDSFKNNYLLVISSSMLTKENFVRACNALSEFGMRVPGDTATAAYYEEHLECIIKEYALSKCKYL